MLLALWPLFISYGQPHHAGQGGGSTKRGQETAKRKTVVQEAAAAHLQRLQEAERGTSVAADSSGALDSGGVPDSVIVRRDVAVRVSRHERTLAGRIPEALGASVTASDVVSLDLDAAVMRYNAKQAADEDDEMAMIIIMMEIT